MGKLKKSFNRENARRAVNWLQDIYNLNIISSRNHSTEQCENDIRIIINHLTDLKKNYENIKLKEETLELLDEIKNILTTTEKVNAFFKRMEESSENCIKENKDLNRKIGILENKLELSEENSKKYSLELEEQIKENENYKRLFSKVQELYQEEHENLLKLSARKWWQIWK